MKTSPEFKNGSGQGEPTFDRSYTKQNERLKENGISNAGGQRSDQTSGKNNIHKSQKKRML
ncbi:MAG: hypothetical protein ACXVJD_04255 [Mucilaginibacter sp.]